MAEPSPQPRLVPFFPTQIVIESWPGFEAGGAALRDTILARRAADRDPSPRWRSTPDLPHWGGEAARALCDHVLRRIDGMTVDKEQRAEGRGFRWTMTGWAEVLDRHGAIDLRSHPGSSWTAICDIDDGGGTEGGDLVFLDPRYPAVRMPIPELRPRRRDGTPDQHEVRIAARSGAIVMFPSWLMHGVRPFDGDRPRVSIGLTFRADWIG
ncbi:putative 2OG-Fe(II) oxygenase [Rhizorhabdus dicambivorans]|uniref:putative 2OG-Fe(II) oxygenase n=1 Tax=Rhizorhabdus dicambivorans TaxID=1850238 RepID=UPI0008340A96|nr:putative 2OG-Fe(II) oxygenase [Rhizorhabdus dicambivorans]